MLFGKDCTVQKAFDLLDKDKNGEVRKEQLILYLFSNDTLCDVIV